MSTVTHADEQRLAPRATLPVIMLALATVVSAMASLNVAIPSIARDTHATQTQLSWIIDAYALVFAALLLLGGAIGDRYGRRTRSARRPRDLRRGLGRGHDRQRPRLADRHARSPRRRRRTGHAGDAVDHHQHLPARAEDQGGRRLGRRRRSAAPSLGLLASGVRARGMVVAVGVRPERRAGRDRDHRHPPGHPGVCRPRGSAPRPGRCADHGRSGSASWSTRSSRHRATAGAAHTPSAASRSDS